MPTQTNEQRYYDALKRIARGYKTAAQLRKDDNVEFLGLEEVLEMAYENIQNEARTALGRRKRPTNDVPKNVKAVLMAARKQLLAEAKAAMDAGHTGTRLLRRLHTVPLKYL